MGEKHYVTAVWKMAEEIALYHSNELVSSIRRVIDKHQLGQREARHLGNEIIHTMSMAVIGVCLDEFEIGEAKGCVANDNSAEHDSTIINEEDVAVYENVSMRADAALSGCRDI